MECCLFLPKTSGDYFHLPASKFHNKRNVLKSSQPEYPNCVFHLICQPILLRSEQEVDVCHLALSRTREKFEKNKKS